MMIINEQELNWHTFSRMPQNRGLTVEQMRQRFLMEQAMMEHILPVPAVPVGGPSVHTYKELTPQVELMTENNEILITELGDILIAE